MADTKLEQSIIHHAKEAIAKSESEALKQYGTAVIVPAEMAKKANMEGEHLSQFLKEVEAINAREDTLLLVCLGMIYAGATSKNASSMFLPELSEETLGFVMMQYTVTKKLVNSERAAELFPDDASNKLMNDFEWLISVTIGRLYKKSPLWKQRLMWQLVKEWNGRQFNAGIGSEVRKKLGEDEALALFRETANSIMNNPELLNKAVNDYHESNPYAK